jgi:HK97 family phage major capsid protein
MGNEFNEPKVHEEVLSEIKKLGDSVTASQKNYDELRSNHKKLQEQFEKGVGGSKETIEKLKEDILTRQEELDASKKEINNRIDQVEAALQRPNKGIIQPGDEQYKAAKQLLISSMAVRKETASFDKVKSMEVSVEQYKEYCDAYEVFLRKNKEFIGPEQRKALSVGVDPDGGYTVTPEMSNKVTTKLYESDPIRGLARTETISTDAFEEMVDWSQASYGWETETGAGAETDTPQFKKKRIPVHIMYAKPRVTQQLLEDSGINIEQWLANKVADRFARAEAAAFVTGDGIGKPRGFLTHDSGTSYGQVEQVNMGAAAAITADGFVKIKYALQEYYLNRGTWLMNRTTVRDTMLLKDGVGNYIWKPSMIAGDPSSTILGLPVRMSTTMPTIAANALSVVLADWKEAYVIVDRLGITVQRDPYTVKPFVEFYTRKRMGGDLINYDAIKIGKISA